MFWPGESHGLCIVCGVTKSWTLFHSLSDSSQSREGRERCSKMPSLPGKWERVDAGAWLLWGLILGHPQSGRGRCGAGRLEKRGGLPETRLPRLSGLPWELGF